MNIPIATEAAEFKTISEHDDSEFDKKITKYLQNGWKLFGTPYLFKGTSYIYMVQHLIKQ